MALELTHIHSFFSGFISAVIIYQSAIVAGTVFNSLEREQSSIFLRTIFPKFFKFLSVLGLITFLLCLVSESHYYCFIVSALTIIFSLVCVLIIPMTNRFKDENNDKMFSYMHTLSVILTLSVLFLNVSLIFFINS